MYTPLAKGIMRKSTKIEEGQKLGTQGWFMSDVFVVVLVMPTSAGPKKIVSEI